MMKNRPLTSLCVIGAFLSACSSSETASFSTLQSRALEVADQANALGSSNASEIPTSGTASYSGYLGLNTGTNDVIGDMSLSVDFANDAVSGNASNFISASNIQYTGTLDITGGFVDRTADTALGDPHLLADVDGTLESDNVMSVVDAQLRGTFNGPGRETMSGFVSGTVSNPFNTTALNSANTMIVGTKN